MKRFLCLFLIFVLLAGLAGCSSPSFDPTVFYYCRRPEAYQYFETGSIIVSEDRDLTGHSQDLHYLVALYLAGPLDEELTSPFPRKTRLVEHEISGHSLRIQLTDLDSTMTDAEFSLAAACLAKTCMEYMQCQDATIQSGTRSITINAENVIVFDSAIPENTEGE